MANAHGDPIGIADYPITLRDLSFNTRFAFNEHVSTAGVIDRTKAQSTLRVQKFDPNNIEYRDQRDGLHLLYGGDLGVVSGEFRFVQWSGVIVDTSPALLEDRVARLESALNPENMFAAAPSTRGVMPLDFYCPTSEAGYSPIVHEVIYGRSTGMPAVYDRIGSGLGAVFACQLICPNTRRFLYTAESKAANSGNSYQIALPNWTAAMGASVAALVTLVLTGAGGATTTVRYVDTALATTTDFNLNLSGIGGGAHTVAIDMGSGAVTLDGARRDDLMISAVDTTWRIGPGGGTMSIPNTGGGRTNLTSATAVYRQARA